MPIVCCDELDYWAFIDNYRGDKWLRKGFALAQGNPEQIAAARSFLIWGVVGVVIAVMAWSIPFIIRNTIGQGI